MYNESCGQIYITDVDPYVENINNVWDTGILECECWCLGAGVVGLRATYFGEGMWYLNLCRNHGI